MKNEIKEILDKLKNSVNYPIIDVPTMDGTDSEPMENTVLLEPNESKIILDYITNLQARNEKAIEYIKQNSKCGGSFIDDKFVIEYIDEIYNGMELLNILKGSDKDA